VDGVPDLAAGAAVLAAALREEGVEVTPERSARLVGAVILRRPRTRDQLYVTARACVVTGRAQLPAFDRAFARLLDGVWDPADSRGDPSNPELDADQRAGRPAPGARSQPRGGDASPPQGWAPAASRTADGELRDEVLAAASTTERLGERSFSSLDPGELARVRALIAAFRLAPPLRRSHRRRPARGGDRVDLRRTVRASLRTGGEPAELLMRGRVVRPRRLVLLLDVSGSMEPYSRAFLHLLQGAVAGTHAEAFVFATRLTRLTRALTGRNPEAAFQRAAASAPDWSGGTRIGEALAAFNREYGRRGMSHGAVVVIVSDGWETGDPDLVGREVQRLARHAHRLLWVNPRAQDPRFAPLTGGMAAALPHVDRLLSGHSLDALADVVEAIAA